MLAHAVATAFAVAIMATGSGTMAEDAALDNAVLRNFSGDFHWLGDSHLQIVGMRFVSLARLDEGRLEATGCGRYDVGAVGTDIRVHMIVEEQTRSVEIWEFNPIGSASFVIDGSHKGKLADDLGEIDAEWTTNTSGAKGVLRLRAGGGLICSPQVAFAR